MASQVRRIAVAGFLPSAPRHLRVHLRTKTTSAQYVAARARDATFEKLMDAHKHLIKVVAVVDLLLASPDHSAPLSFLSSLAQKLHLNRGAPHFLRRHPHVFTLSSGGAIGLTAAAAAAIRRESLAATADASNASERLVRLLSISPSRALPLRAIFKVWRELGLPDDFEDSIIASNPRAFALRDNPREPNTHLLELVAPGTGKAPILAPAVEEWRRRRELAMKGKPEAAEAEMMAIKFGFNQGFPPGMRLSKNFKAKVKEWQRLPYAGPYEINAGGGKSKAALKRLEKRAVGIVHEFLSITVEKMAEVEKMSHFRQWFGMDLNIRDLFLDHPGIFYLSAKGKRHTVFLREAYERGRLVDQNPLHEARMELMKLVLLGKRDFMAPVAGVGGVRENHAAQVFVEISEEQSKAFQPTVDRTRQCLIAQNRGTQGGWICV